ncbi:hypothetical protein OEA23_22315 [Paenibacillus polysaccharolyticus]
MEFPKFILYSFTELTIYQQKKKDWFNNIVIEMGASHILMLEVGVDYIGIYIGGVLGLDILKKANSI